MIEYRQHEGRKWITVLLDNRIVGTIKTVDGGYQYFPKGKKVGGEVFKTLLQCYESLENE